MGKYNYSLEHKILNIALCIGIVLCLMASVKNYLLGLDNILVIITIAGSVVFSFLYYLSACKKLFLMPLFLAVFFIIVIMIPVHWSYKDGLMGSLPYYIIIVYIMVTILAPRLWRIPFLFCLTLMCCALLLLEYQNPSLVRGYINEMIRYIDITFAVAANIIANGIILVTLLSNYHDDHGRVRQYLTQLKMANEDLRMEMTERRQAEEALRESEDKYRTIFQTTGTAVIIIEEDTTISLVNEEFEKLTGYSRQDVEGISSWKQFFAPDCLDKMTQYHYQRRIDSGAAPKSYESRIVDRFGNIIDVLVNVSLIPGAKKSVSSFVDISYIKLAEEKLKYLATHDYLTGIPNRYSFEESLKKAVLKAGRGKESALLFIDIDNFKLVNDTQGHAAGDNLLIIVANTIKANLRQSDTLARLGGDEFGVLLEDTSIDEARIVAEKLRRITEENEFCVVNYGCFNLSLSIGVVIIEGSLSSQRLLALADTALYAAKDKGRNRVVLLDHTEEMTTRYLEINSVIALIKNAVKEDKFILRFQPVVSLDSSEIIHYEVLISLKGEDNSLISPMAFIPTAERFGLMPQIDRWVVGAALGVLKQNPGLNLFMNISGMSLSEESLLQYIEEMISQSGIEPCRIGFEITETAAVKDMMLARRWIERLKSAGCRFALDDFGIGFSSFSYLRMLPVDYLKIDGSFICNLDKDPSNRALVEAMNNIARSMGIKTVAERVENSDVLAIINELKVDYAQGYFLGKPSQLIQPYQNSKLA